MNPRIIFALSTFLTLISSTVFATLYVWPWLRTMSRDRGLSWLVAPHMFFRFIGLSFLVPGVVSPTIPPTFAVPAAYGDLGAGILAVIAMYGLAKRAPWTIASIWAFNVWGAADLLFAFYAGPKSHLVPGSLGAAYFIPTALVPVLLVTHALVFSLLVAHAGPARDTAPVGPIDRRFDG